MSEYLANIVRSATGQCFGLVVVTDVHLALFLSWRISLLIMENSTLIVVVLSPGVRVGVAVSEP